MGNLTREVGLIEASTLFDSTWYMKRYPDVAMLNIGAAEHYMRVGAMLLRDPGPGFSTRRYIQAYPDVAVSGLNPLVHYLTLGQAEQRRCFPVPPLVPQASAEEALAWDRRTLQHSPLFDRDYYLATYPDVRKHGMDPLLHFLKHGAREGRQPNPWFSTRRYRATYQLPDDTTNPLIHYIVTPGSDLFQTSALFDGHFYLSRYPDVKGGSKPLEHYLTAGMLEGRQTTFAAPAGIALPRIIDCRRVKTTVIVPVYNACAETRDCIESVRRHTHLGETNHLLVIDDASTDPAVRELLDDLADLPGVRVIRNQSNLGYTRTINKGCELAGTDDVVLLNSDTIVGPHWLRNLKIAAYRTDRTGTVTPVSNNAGAFSVPQSGSNPLPGEMDMVAMARVAMGCRFDTPFEVPTGNGFCFYIKRALLDDVGLFDAENFPVGYGEENEFCMRALEAGWCHRVDPGTYVGHVRSASFGDRKRQLAEEGLQRVQQMHPEYAGVIRAMATSPGFALARFQFARKLAQWRQAGRLPKPRIMYVISTRVGGTPQTNADLMHAVAGTYDCYALCCDRYAIEVLRAKGTDYEVLQRYPLLDPLRFATHVSGEYDDIVRFILSNWGIDLLHVRHLAWHSLNLIDVAGSLDIPVIHSFHDFYTVCPSVTLVGGDGRYHPSGVTGQVRNPLWRNDSAAIDMTPEGLAHWQQRMQKALSACQAFVTTCLSARDILVHALPALAKRTSEFHIIPHGRDFEQFRQEADPDAVSGDKPLRILLPGNIGLQKGLELIKQIKRLDLENKLEFHLLGKGGPGLAEYVVDHGTYHRHQFAECVAEIRPHVAALLSISPETWCHTLTECWSCGVPVVGIDLGAIGERVRNYGGGWLIAHPAGVETMYAELLSIRRATADRQEKTSRVLSWQRGEGRTNSTELMGRRYIDLYQKVMEYRIHIAW